MYGLSSALIGVVCFVTCKLHAIFSGNSFTKSRMFFWNVKHIWSHYNFKKSKQMCTTTDAEPRLPFSTRPCSCSLLTEILFAAEQARALRVLRLFGFNWNLNTMLTSILRTLRAFILFFLFLKPGQLSSSFTDHSSVFLTVTVLLFILAAAKQSGESLLHQMHLVSTDAADGVSCTQLGPKHTLLTSSWNTWAHLCFCLFTVPGPWRLFCLPTSKCILSSR